MRLFVAIHFSPEVKNVLLSAMDDLRACSRSGNFTHPENLHLTLAFIGETTELTKAKSAVGLCAGPPFDIAVGGFGHFGKLYWAGIERNPTLAALADKLQNDLRRAGFDIETREFKPHITIAREVVCDSPPRIEIPRTVMTAKRVSLMRSDRITGKLTYTEVYGKNL